MQNLKTTACKPFALTRLMSTAAFTVLALSTSPLAAQEALTGVPSFGWWSAPGTNGSLSSGAGSLGVADRARPEYDAQGIKVGSFTLLPSLMTSVLYDDNVYARSNSNAKKVGDLSYSILPGFVLRSDWNQHSLRTYGNAEYLGYRDNTGLNHVNGAAGADAVVNVTRDMKWSLGTRYEHQIEPFGIGESVGNFDKLVAMDRLSGYVQHNQSFNRFRLGLLGSVKDENFTDGETAGVKADQSYRNNTQYLGALRAGYETAPGAILFTEGSADRKQFKTSTFTSTGYKGVVGVETELGKLVKGEVYAGYAQRQYQLASLKDVNYFTYGGALSWYATPLATISLRGGRDVNETLLSGAPGTYVVSNVGTRLDYEVLRNLILSGRIGYEHHEYNDVDRQAELIRSGVGATYLVNRNFTVGLDYSRIDYTSTSAGTDYARNQYGLTLKSKF
jgi:hypothetical protein